MKKTLSLTAVAALFAVGAAFAGTFVQAGWYEEDNQGNFTVKVTDQQVVLDCPLVEPDILCAIQKDESGNPTGLQRFRP